MRITKGTVVDGIVVEGEPLSEESSVTVPVGEQGAFTLNTKEEAALLESIAEADWGDLLDADDVLKRACIDPADAADQGHPSRRRPDREGSRVVGREPA